MSTLSPTSHRLRLLVAGIAVAAAVSACGNDSTGGANSSTAESAQAGSGESTNTAAAVTVDVKDMKFSPADITVKAGETVTWKFDDGGVPHTVTGLKDVGMSINSPIQKDGEYSHVFDKPGTYKYICTIHPEMVGTVTVE